jgi:DNA-binding XRE family transcriptional regulator
MAIKKGHRDPRTEAERRGDEEVLAKFEAGKFLAIAPEGEAAAIKRVEQAYETGRRLAAGLGSQLGILRRGRGMSQEQLARIVGTKKSNISRLESGRDGGMSIERFLAILQTLSELPIEASLNRPSRAGLIHDKVFERFRVPIDCLETVHE